MTDENMIYQLKAEVVKLQNENDELWIALDKTQRESAEDRAELQEVLKTSGIGLR